MRLARRVRFSRSLRHRAAAVGAAGLLLVTAASCSPVDEPDHGPPSTVERAVGRVTADESATLLADLAAPRSHLRDMLRELGSDPGPERVRALRRAEFALALQADGPLNGLAEYGPGTRVAYAVSLGGRDVLATKSADGRVYLRLRLAALADAGVLTAAQRARVDDVTALAGQLPDSLAAAARFLRGRWVAVDGDDFAEYGWALEEFTGVSVSQRRLRGAAALTDGSDLRAALGALRDVLVEHTTYRRAGDRHGADEPGEQRLRVDLPARRTADALAPLLERVDAGIVPERVPRHRVPGVLTVRRGTLAELRVDLGRLTGTAARVPLRLRFATGDVFSPNPPRHSVALAPQDLLAAALYARVHRP
ncbi:hypothetical protein [Streptomyces sp. TR06-5]|uniref:hypothetical protein n=1 Tax=unclassified Streptomyces TaxID=2593676 RepID=UPI0039A2474E